MRTLQLSTHLEIGGIGSYIVTLAAALKAKGADVVVASSGGGLEETLKGYGIEHRAINIRTKSELSPKIIIAVMQVAGIVRRDKINLIHAHTRVSQVVAFLVSKLTGVPYVTTCHGFFKVRARRIFDTWGAKVIAISDAVKRHLVDDLGVSPARVEVIYTGIDTGKFARPPSGEEAQGVREKLGLSGRRVIGTIGRLSPVKGQQYLIEAMGVIAASRKDAACLIVGNGPDENSLKSLAISLGVDDEVRFVESSPDTPKLLAVMDVFVFPSVKEGLGLALLEALAAGKACVASRVGGIEDIIKDGENGILVKPRDPKEIAAAVLKILSDPALGQRLGSKGLELVRERFDIGRTAEKALELYQRVIGRRSYEK